MEALKTILPLLVSGSLSALVLAVGLDADFDDVLFLFRRPKLLLRAFVAISVLVPLAAVVVVSVLPLDPLVKVGLLVMAVAPVPPLVPGKDLKLGGRKEYVYGLYVAFAVLAVLIVPATMAMLGRVYGREVDFQPLKMALSVGASVLIPLAVGTTVHVLAPQLAARLAPWVSKLSMLLIVIVIAPLIVVAAPAMWGVLGDGALVGMLGITAVGVIGGHLLGGPDPRDRAALAAAAATRHPGIAMMIANANVHHKGVAAVVLVFLLQSLIVVGVYKAWLKHGGKQAQPTIGRAF